MATPVDESTVGETPLVELDLPLACTVYAKVEWLNLPDTPYGGGSVKSRDAGASIHFVDADEGYDAVLERCERLVEENPGKYHRPNQYTNPHNPGVHEQATGPEVWDQTGGGVTHFVAGVGTGGTVTGVGRALHDRGDVSVVGFEPADPLHAIDGLKYLRTGDLTADDPVVLLFADRGDKYADIPLWEDYL